jgi:hypothetical protein
MTLVQRITILSNFTIRLNYANSAKNLSSKAKLPQVTFFMPIDSYNCHLWLRTGQT